jgi:hypothetical protein
MHVRPEDTAKLGKFVRRFTALRHHDNKVLSALVRAVENPSAASRRDVEKLGRLLGEWTTRQRNLGATK